MFFGFGFSNCCYIVHTVFPNSRYMLFLENDFKMDVELTKAEVVVCTLLSFCYLQMLSSLV
jgi:hypothetical protein